jgi:hypothetical protein
MSRLNAQPIDAHWHAFMASAPQALLMTADPGYLKLLRRDRRRH